MVKITPARKEGQGSPHPEYIDVRQHGWDFVSRATTRTAEPSLSGYDSCFESSKNRQPPSSSKRAGLGQDNKGRIVKPELGSPHHSHGVPNHRWNQQGVASTAPAQTTEPALLNDQYVINATSSTSEELRQFCFELHQLRNWRDGSDIKPSDYEVQNMQNSQSPKTNSRSDYTESSDNDVGWFDVPDREAGEYTSNTPDQGHRFDNLGDPLRPYLPLRFGFTQQLIGHPPQRISATFAPSAFPTPTRANTELSRSPHETAVLQCPPGVLSSNDGLAQPYSRSTFSLADSFEDSARPERNGEGIPTSAASNNQSCQASGHTSSFRVNERFPGDWTFIREGGKVRKTKRRPQKSSRTKVERCIRCSEHKKICQGYPCQRCVSDKNALYGKLCFKPEIIDSANFECIKFEMNRYLSIVRADATSVWRPTPEGIEVEYRYGLALPRRIWIHKVEVHDPRQLDVSIYDGVQYKAISTPAYAMNLRPEVEEFYMQKLIPELFDELVEVYVLQIKENVLDYEISDVHKHVILYSYDFARPRETTEQKLVWMSLQMWANTTNQSYYGTIDPLSWQGNDRPEPVNEPGSINYHQKYIAPKLVDVQFAIYTSRVHARLEREAIALILKLIVGRESERWKKWLCCFLAAYMLMSSWEDDNFLYGWNKAAGRHADNFEWPHPAKPNADDLIARNTHLFKQMRNYFQVVCRGENLFQLDWNNEETRKMVRNDHYVIRFMKEIGSMLYNQDKEEIMAKRNATPDFDDEDATLTGSFSSWLIFDDESLSPPCPG